MLWAFESLRLEAIASDGYTFVSWGGDVVERKNPLHLSMDGPKTIVAYFEPL